MALRVLVVDDTIVYRKIVSDILATLPDIVLIGTAANGKIALNKVRELQPDVLILDIEMPEMNGIEVLQALRRDHLPTGAIMLSRLTVEGGDLTMKALQLGAFDFVAKPDGASPEKNREELRSALGQLLKAFSYRHDIRKLLGGGAPPGAPATAAAPGARVATATAAAPSPAPFAAPPRALAALRPAPGASEPAQSAAAPGPASATAARTGRSEVVALGISTGGPKALADMMPLLPGDLGVPLLIVQHMPPLFTASLAGSLDGKCQLRVKEAEDGEVLQPNVAYIAPGGRQMRVTPAADPSKRLVRITDDPPENHCRPSADYLFRSVAQHYPGRATGVIMTGLGNDGTLGLRLMKRSGAVVIAQDEASCVVFGMPKEAIAAKVVDVVASLENLADEITKTVRWR